MRGVLLLAYRRVPTSPVSAAALGLCVALSIAVPLSTNIVAGEYEHDLRARAATTPLVAGASGSRFDLVFGALYFRRSGLPTIPFSTCATLREGGYADTIAMHLRYTARGHPIVGVGSEYYGFRGLRVREGTVPLILGNALLGHSVAATLGLGVGDSLFSDQLDAFDITKPPRLEMNIVGVLEPTGTADDRAVFVDVRSAWVIEGLLHGHADAGSGIDAADVLARTDEHVVVNPTMIEENHITDENAGTFHPHGDEGTFPITSVIVIPRSEKGRTIVAARYENDRTLQLVAPDDVVDELLGFVFRVRSLLNAISVVLGASTVILLALVGVLTFKIRADEVRTLDAIGCGRVTVAAIYLTELGIIVVIGVVGAGVMSGVAVGFGAELIRTLSAGG